MLIVLTEICGLMPTKTTNPKHAPRIFQELTIKGNIDTMVISTSKNIAEV
jgi:hypothetical protein